MSSQVSNLHFIQTDKDRPIETTDGKYYLIKVKISLETVKGMLVIIDSQQIKSTHCTATFKC